jgi:hypothetical protein
MSRKQHKPCSCHACRAKAKGIALGPPLPLPAWANSSSAFQTYWIWPDTTAVSAPLPPEPQA